MKKSAYLGQFTDETANEIAGHLEEAAIEWSYKQAGWFTQILFIGEWGTRLFVDSSRLDEARAIVAHVTEDGPAPQEDEADG